MARTTNLKIRISPEEEAALREQAKDANCNLSQLIRRKLGLDQVPPITIKIEQAKAAQARLAPQPKPANVVALKLPPLCVRCERIGRPSCPSCLKAAMG